MATRASPVRISILTPIFNGVEFLEQCALSVLLQIPRFGTLQFEWDWWIGVNGHGLSGGAVAQKVYEVRAKAGLAADQIHVRVYAEANKARTLNAMAQEARGEWFAVLDVDDTWERPKLIMQVGAAVSRAAGAAVIGTFCDYFGEMNRPGPLLPSGWIAPEILAEFNPIINSSALVRREVALWSDRWRGLDDYDLWFRIVNAGGRLYNIPMTLTHHRVYSGSAFNATGQQDIAGLRAWWGAKKGVVKDT